MVTVPAMIGLLMVNEEDDILERTLEHNAQWLDAFYVLDGTADNSESERICRSHPKCWAYRTDDDLPRPPYTEEARCGYRQFLYDLATQDHGHDNWFMVLHADELWTRSPWDTIRDHPGPDGYVFLLPFFFPKAGEEWDDNQHPLDQLHWHLRPGFPEFRLFRGRSDVAYDPTQRFNTAPAGLRSIQLVEDTILHYPYRSPQVQRTRAAVHEITQFDPDNYRHITDHDSVYWTDDMIADYQQREWFTQLDTLKVPF